MTTPETELQDVLRDLVAAYTEHPEAIVLERQTAPGSCYWMLRGHPEDEGKLVGNDGCHVRALEFLVERFGAARDETHTFRLITLQKPGPRKQKTRRDVTSYDPEPKRLLLERLLLELSLDAFAVSAGPGTAPRTELTFEFRILVRSFDDYQALTAPTSASLETVVGALGTLFRAIGKKNGVRFDLVVTCPKP